MARKIADVYELPYGLIARSNDGRLFFLKSGFGEDVFSADWKALPEIPQEGYATPSDDELEGTMAAMQKGMKSILGELASSGVFGGHHHMHERPSNKCPIEGCDFESSDVATMTAHLTQKHQD